MLKSGSGNIKPARQGDEMNQTGVLRAGSSLGWLGEALRQTAPIVMGYIPVGFAYGVLAQKAGLSDFNTLAMSVLVFAGSAQLIAVGMLGAGAGPLAIVLTTFVVNLRHLLMSAALSTWLRGWSRKKLAWFAFQLTDETFALHSARFSKGNIDAPTTLGINLIAQSAWVSGTCLGMFAGGLIGDVRPIGLDFALAGMFIFLLLGQIKSRTHFVVALCGAFGAILMKVYGAGQFSVIGATVLAATIGLGVERWIRK